MTGSLVFAGDEARLATAATATQWTNPKGVLFLSCNICTFPICIAEASGGRVLMRARTIAAVLLALAMSCLQAFAWGPDAHQLVGSIADRLLNDHAKQQVQNILA